MTFLLGRTFPVPLLAETVAVLAVAALLWAVGIARPFGHRLV